MKKLTYAIIGFGGLGKKHFRNTEELTKAVGNVELTAICDINESAFVQQTDTNISTAQTNLDLSAYRLYTDVKELLEQEELDFVITALPTYLHEKIAVQVMERKIHVFSEKPIALNVGQAQRMIDTARLNQVKLMIGQCVRYAPVSALLKELIASEKYGKVLYAHFERFSGPPVWTWKKWMLDEEKSGGAALDLHIHDVDLIQWLFGLPKAITSRRVATDMEHDTITTIYDYPDKYVTASASWGLTESYQFRSGLMVRFEHATVEAKAGKVTLYTDEKAEVLALPAANNCLEEIIDFVDCIRNDHESRINTPQSCKVSLELALAEKESAAGQRTILLISQICKK